MKALTTIFILITLSFYGADVIAQKIYYASADAKRTTASKHLDGQSPDSIFSLSSIMAAKMPGSSLIGWKVRNESDTTTFALEKSIDAGKTFIAIAKIQSNGMGTYSFTDNQPVDGQNQYRLKMQDSRGGARYSTVLTLVYPQQNADRKKGVSTDQAVKYLDPDMSPGLNAGSYIKTTKVTARL
jgi:hypothetical protein